MVMMVVMVVVVVVLMMRVRVRLRVMRVRVICQTLFRRPSKCPLRKCLLRIGFNKA